MYEVKNKLFGTNLIKLELHQTTYIISCAWLCNVIVNNLHIHALRILFPQPMHHTNTTTARITNTTATIPAAIPNIVP